MSGEELKLGYDLDFDGNEAQNMVIQNLSTVDSSALKPGQPYFDTEADTLKVKTANGGVKNALASKISDLQDDTATYPIDKADTLTDLTATAAELNILDGATLSTTELNYLDGVTSSVQEQINGKVDSSLLGANNGVATLDSGGKVPSSQLPSFVDDVIEAYIVSGSTALSSGWLSKTSSGSALTPESDKIYVILSDGDYKNKTYRWGGSTYVEISESPGAASESAAGIIEIATQSETNTGTDDTRAITPLKLATYTSGMVKKTIVNQTSALTSTSGICLWSFTNPFSTKYIDVRFINVSTGAWIIPAVNVSDSTISAKFNSASDIAANTLAAVCMG